MIVNDAGGHRLRWVGSIAGMGEKYAYRFVSEKRLGSPLQLLWT